MSTFTLEEKSRIFIERTKDLWPQNWDKYLELIKHETWTKEELYAYNFKRRTDILKFAYENTAFYRKLYDNAGLKPEDIRTEEDWNKVPIVTKDMIAKHSNEFEVKDAIEKFGFVANTGGSTGKPLRVFRDKRHFWQAPFWRFYGWHLGRKPGDVGLDTNIWGMDDASIDRSKYRFTPQEWNQRSVAFWPIQFYNLSPYTEFSDTVAKFVEELAKSPSARIYAYAGGLDMITDYCIEHNITFDNIEFIEVCASPLTEVIRNKAAKVFGENKTFDFYGSNEMGPMALECKYSGASHHLHLQSDLIHIDLVDDNGNPVVGEDIGSTIVTCFDNKVFPFVRYNHGDRTHWINEPCECGLPFPCIAPVKGRISDFLTTKTGLNLDGVGFNEIFDFHPNAAKAFQFRQSKNGFAKLVVVPNTAYENSMKEINLIFDKLKCDFNGKIEFTLELVDNIVYDGGKMRYILHE